MFSHPDFSPRCSRGTLLAAAVAVLAACGASPPIQHAQEAADRIPACACVADEGGARPNPGQSPPSLPPATDADAITRMLAYADRVRQMSPSELSQEVTRLGAVSAPDGQLQLSLALSHLSPSPDLGRAQELLARVLGNASTEAQSLHPLARLLAARYGEQRRLEELLDKQTQQIRDMQRRLDQTNEKLEALKAIERSLTTRPPAAPASAPANRARPASPSP